MYMRIVEQCLFVFRCVGIFPEKRATSTQRIIYFTIMYGSGIKVYLIILLLLRKDNSVMEDYVETFSSLIMFVFVSLSLYCQISSDFVSWFSESNLVSKMNKINQSVKYSILPDNSIAIRNSEHDAF